MRRTLATLACALCCYGTIAAEPSAQAIEYGYRVIAEYPHDRGAFTQGLLFHNGKLYESTGKYGSSSLREVELGSGLVLRRQLLGRRDFGEGLALVDDTLLQLTWTSGHGYRWNLHTFELLGEMPLSYKPARRGQSLQPWGLCYDGSRLILSDGSNSLYFLDPRNFEPLGAIELSWRGRPLERLNELECIDGQVYANIWYSDRIAIIDPDRALVTGMIDLGDLYPAAKRRSVHDVLNGIAWDARGKRLFITGKHWPKLYQIELHAEPEPHD